jgi:RNA polymerase sporulation-specific sigma factor
MMTDERNKLIMDNLNLVHYVIRTKFCNTSVEYDDLAQTGMIGLIKAAIGFDASKGYSFAAYAIRCILNEIYILLRYNKRRVRTLSIFEKIEQTEGLTYADVLESDFNTEGECFATLDIKLALDNSNDLTKKVMLLCADGLLQRKIAERLRISRSYVNRIERRFWRAYHDAGADRKRIANIPGEVGAPCRAPGAGCGNRA